MKKQFTVPSIEIKQLNIHASLLQSSTIPISPNPTGATEPEEVKSLLGGLKNNISWD